MMQQPCCVTRATRRDAQGEAQCLGQVCDVVLNNTSVVGFSDFVWSGGVNAVAQRLLEGDLVTLADEGLVDVGDDTAARDGGLDQRVQLLVTADGQLQVAGGDALHLCGGEEVGGCRWARQRGRTGPAELENWEHSSWRRRRLRVAATARPHLQVLGGVASQLQHLGGEVLCTGRQEGARQCKAWCPLSPTPRVQADAPRMAALYTAAVAPTRPPAEARDWGRAGESVSVPRRGAPPFGRQPARLVALSLARAHLQEAVDTTDRELEAGLQGAGHGLLLVALGHRALGALAGQALGALA